MRRSDRDVTVRVVPLESREAAEATVEGTVDERLALVARLSETGWALTGRPTPTYVRAEIPVVVIGRDALVRNKRATGRHKDLADLESLGEA